MVCFRNDKYQIVAKIRSFIYEETYILRVVFFVHETIVNNLRVVQQRNFFRRIQSYGSMRSTRAIYFIIYRDENVTDGTDKIENRGFTCRERL